jgi:hypothetical protein
LHAAGQAEPFPLLPCLRLPPDGLYRRRRRLARGELAGGELALHGQRHGVAYRRCAWKRDSDLSDSHRTSHRADPLSRYRHIPKLDRYQSRIGVGGQARNRNL